MLDVAVAGLRRGRAHAEGDDAAGARRRGGDGEAACSAARVGDRVVGRRAATAPRRGRLPPTSTAAAAIAGALLRPTGSSRMRGAAIAGGAELLGDQEAVLLVADDDRRRRSRSPRARSAVSCEHRAVGDQRPELLGEALARHRPEPGAGAAGEDDRDDGGCRSCARSLPETGVGSPDRRLVARVT